MSLTNTHMYDLDWAAHSAKPLYVGGRSMTVTSERCACVRGRKSGKAEGRIVGKDREGTREWTCDGLCLALRAIRGWTEVMAVLEREDEWEDWEK